MKKFYLFFIIIMSALILSSCNLKDTSSYNEQIVSLPDETTKITVNGYKNNSVEVSSNNSQINDDKDITIVGNKNSKKYHLISCKYAEKINGSNKIYFKSIDEAKKKEYSPCSVCIN